MSTETKSLTSATDPDEPGSLALAVINETKDVVFKKPFPVAGSKRKVEILDEESYLEVSFCFIDCLFGFNLLFVFCDLLLSVFRKSERSFNETFFRILRK